MTAAPDAAPRYELRQVFDDGSESSPHIVTVAPQPWEAAVTRKGFFGAGVTAATAMLLLGACASKRNLTYQQFDEVTKTMRTFTLPCGSPIPPGATCTCNCVAAPAPSPSTTTHRTCTCVPVCTCNRVCTCVPVCQAHYLLHQQPLVRTLAEQLLLAMGPSRLPYMQWAATTAPPPLRQRIGEFADRMARGERPDPLRWPCLDALRDLIADDDDVIRVMAAQAACQVALADLRAGELSAFNQHVNRELAAAFRRYREIEPQFA